jgi:peptidoglycan/xylan/chitin deacetylase (PgdA/CDA1 family)
MADMAGDPSGVSEIQVCPWRGGKRWAYSITFDEALSELHRFTIPILAEYAIPGHLEVVAGHIGKVRQLGQSSYNGFHHMTGEELREMLARGWGVGNHSWSHLEVNAKTADLELGRAKEVIEETICQPISVYCAPGSNVNMNPEALEGCRRFGYLGAMGITDALNRPDDPDPLWLNRSFLHDQGYEPFYSEFNPFRNVLHAKRDHGWIIDYLHCPLEKAVHRNKDCSQAQLRERVETIVAEGADEVWLAKVDDAVDYRYCRRHTRIEETGPGSYTVSAPELPRRVRQRMVTLELPGTVREARIDGQPAQISRRPVGRALLDVDVSTARRLSVT